MTRLRTALIQPPLDGSGRESHDRTTARGLELVDEALSDGAQLVCLPEYFGVIGLDDEPDGAREAAGDRVLDACRVRAMETGATILCPTVEFAVDGRYNSTYLIGPDGEAVYRKTHLTLSERRRHGLSAGDRLPVFDVTGTAVGVATCYDMYFPETARVLALAGAQLLVFPALQRAEQRETVVLQVRARAYDNCLAVARVAYGYPAGTAPRSDIVLGGTCVADWEGRVIADLGWHEGVLRVDLPLAEPRLRRRSFEDEAEDPSRYLYEDRRPELYGALAEPVQSE